MLTAFAAVNRATAEELGQTEALQLVRQQTAGGISLLSLLGFSA
jgi:hypothetical protein